MSLKVWYFVVQYSSASAIDRSEDSFYMYVQSVLGPARVVAGVREVARADARLERAQVEPRLARLQPRVRHRLVYRETLALLHLQQVVDQVDRCRKVKKYNINNSISA